MSLSTELRRVAVLVDRLEARGVDVEAAERTEAATVDDRVRVELELSVPLDGDLDALGRAGGPDRDSDREGRVTPTVRASRRNGAAGGQDSPERNSSDPDESGDGGEVHCREPDCDETFETAHGMKIHHTKTHVSDGDPPDYRDPERLRAAYDSCETLAEMRDYLEADVTVTTIRRQLMAHDIHEPNGDGQPASTASDDSAEDDVEDAASPRGEEADAVDGSPSNGAADGGQATGVDGEQGDGGEDTVDAEALDGGVSVDALCEAVKAAHTVYDVERALDVDRETAIDLLREFDLLEIVHGRVADESQRTEQREEVDKRISQGAGSAD